MQVHHKPTKILIVGKSGSGKTTYMLRYVMHSGHETVFIFDHKGEFEEREDLVPSLTLDDCGERLKNGEKIVCYQHHSEYPGDADVGFQDFCAWVFRVCRVLREDGKSRLFVCDEVNRFTGTSDMGDDFRCLIEDGRLQGLDFIGTSHAANQIHNRLRLQLSEIVALRTIDPRPLQFLEENGFNPEEVKELQTGEFIAKDLDNDEFSRGKLFSCAQRKETVEAEITDETKELNQHAISHPPRDTDAVHGQRDPRQHD
jgi:hypothetical protein